MVRRLVVACMTIVFVAFADNALAAVDVNEADAAQLQTIDGIGPAISARIVAERKNGAFEDWDDLVRRVPGFAEKNAIRSSASGLTVDGAAKPVDKPDPNLLRRTNPERKR